MAMMRRWSYTCSITQCSMSRATPEATSRYHPATTHSVLPRWPPGWQQTKKDITCPHFDGCFDGHRDTRYSITRIAQWRRVMDFIKATKCRHQASTRSDITQSDTPTPVVLDISPWKRAPVDMLAHNNNRGLTCQTDEMHLIILPE